VECGTLVDECADLKLVQHTVGGVSLATENARTVQEDCHRFRLDPGSAIVYRMDGPIGPWRVYSFTGDGDAEIEVSLSTDGKHYRGLDVSRSAFSSGQSVYGYLTPVLVQGDAAGYGGLYLRIARRGSRADADKDAKISEADAQPPMELSRIEIEFSRVGR
jgi:hypothetical protein